MLVLSPTASSGGLTRRGCLQLLTGGFDSLCCLQPGGVLTLSAPRPPNDPAGSVWGMVRHDDAAVCLVGGNPSSGQGRSSPPSRTVRVRLNGSMQSTPAWMPRAPPGECGRARVVGGHRDQSVSPDRRHTRRTCARRCAAALTAWVWGYGGPPPRIRSAGCCIPSTIRARGTGWDRALNAVQFPRDPRDSPAAAGARPLVVRPIQPPSFRCHHRPLARVGRGTPPKPLARGSARKGFRSGRIECPMRGRISIQRKQDVLSTRCKSRP